MCIAVLLANHLYVFWQCPKLDMNSIRCRILLLDRMHKQLFESMLQRESVVCKNILMLRIKMGQQLIGGIDDLWKPFLRFQVIRTIHKEQCASSGLWQNVRGEQFDTSDKLS